ncbi:MAG: DUF1080 domain-containing protein [Bacteroidales bacterium]|nr:DUF1080 domain-containing protein [Bacteroidales bacterium]
MLRTCLGLAVALGLSSAAFAADPTPPKGFTALFNGKDLTGWHGWAIHAKGGSPYDLQKLSAEEKAKTRKAWTEEAQAHWKAENGEIIHDGKDGKVSLATDREFGDAEFLIEYKISPNADSGVYVKGTPQIQVWDPANVAQIKLGTDKGSGGLWNNSISLTGKHPLVKADKPAGEWNRFRILVIGDYVTVYLNDQLVVDHCKLDNFWDRSKPNPKPLPAITPLLLQAHPPGEVRWRNIFGRDIPAAEANEILRKKAGAGFAPIFDGKSFAGWTGATNDYEVVDGAIACKPKKGGVLFTNERYDDFVVQLEYKVPPGGNNGLALRYPGTGGPSQVAMCEIQILDDDAPKYAKLDPRQYTGSAYGMSAPHRGFQRQPGEWNFMVVTVQGPTIQVELNGHGILNTDLSKVTEFKDKTAHVGKDRTEGHFGFCGHNDPVAFRSIAIKKLPKTN